MEENSEKINILLVDDHPDGLIALEAVLKSSQYTLVLASSGAQAILEVGRGDFAIIIMDVQMPGMDGFQTAARIKQKEKSKYIPIIFVTAINKDPRYVFEGYQAGAVDYLFKPFEPAVLVSKVAVFVDLFKKTKELRFKSDLLQQSEQHNRLLIESATDIIATTDTKGAITSLNPAFAELTGWPTSEWLGKSFEDLVDDSEKEITRKALERCMTGESFLFEINIHTSAQKIPLEGSTRPLMKDRECIGVLLIARDITVRKEMEGEKLRLRELERSNNELRHFASICSHDLQEPLRLMGAFAQLLKKRYESALDEEAQQYIDFITSGSHRMSQLIKDLLEYSRLDAAEIELDQVDTNRVVQQAIELLHGSIQETGASIQTRGLPVILSNNSQLLQLFQNLITNAIKFRQSFPVKVEISASQKNGEWFFCVKDNGIGIDMQFASGIFDIFKRLHTREEYPGTGIGLAICKKIVEKQCGRIWVESQVGIGSIFYFTLPAVKSKGISPRKSDRLKSEIHSVTC